MKCQNCGKNEINFHYSSNVNGRVTEAHLCSEGAVKSGYDMGSLFSSESIFDSYFPAGMRQAFLPIPMFGFRMAPMLASWPMTGLPSRDPSKGPSKECACGCEREAPVQEKPAAEVDGEMLKRREINAIREQMRIAAEREDFEKAAQLRDQIRQLEAG